MAKSYAQRVRDHGVNRFCKELRLTSTSTIKRWLAKPNSVSRHMLDIIRREINRIAK